MVMPGDNIKMTVELIAPIAMEEGLRFAIREGGRTVGAGVVSKILEVISGLPLRLGTTSYRVGTWQIRTSASGSRRSIIA